MRTESMRARTTTRGRRIGTAALTAALTFLITAGIAAAGEDWNFSVDAAAYAGTTYVGSDEYFITPLPAFRATRGAGATTWFVSLPLEGVGVSRRLSPSGLTGSLALNFGGNRHPDEYSVLGFPVDHGDRIGALLAGSAEVTTPVVVEAKLEYPALFGLLGASLGYHPTSVEFGGTGDGDEVRHGALLTLQYQTFVPVTRRFAVGGSLGVELMDGAYAEAWYSVTRATKQLAEYEADGGLRDAQATLFASYRLAANVNLSLAYRNMLLLGDAADCPYTVDERQQSCLLTTSYSF